ncbi:MAG: EamA family transporter [Pseudomonadota bacterium]
MTSQPQTRQRINNHRKGLVITGIGAFLMTFDIPLVRLAESDEWTVVYVRGMCVFFVMLGYWFWTHHRRGNKIPFINGVGGFAAAATFAVTNISFMTAIHHTTAANAVFILAFAPLFAAILSRIFLAEPVRIHTWLAIGVAIAGILIIATSGFDSGHTFGDLMALLAATSLASSLTIMRWSGKDMTFSPGFGSLLTAIVAVWFADPFSLNATQTALLGFNSLLIMPISLGLLALGTRYISAPEVAMLMLLDSFLAPVWVWLLLGEVPAGQVLIGGGIVISAILVHSVIQAKRA